MDEMKNVYCLYYLGLIIYKNARMFLSQKNVKLTLAELYSSFSLVFLHKSCPWQGTESIATLPPFGPIEGHKWFIQISSQ
jgi:hypothetical protein